MKKFKTIVLIDDNESDIFISKKVIEDLKLVKHVQIFSSAIRALDFFKTTYENSASYASFLPILILLDNHMPGMNGLEFLEAFNKLAVSDRNQIDILMLSTDIPPQIKTAIHKKCLGYIEKPLTSEKLLLQLEIINTKGCDVK